jgi:transposase
LLKVEQVLWLFVHVEGIEPTNNAAERALRPAVIWRRTSLGTQSTQGSQFVARAECHARAACASLAPYWNI